MGEFFTPKRIVAATLAMSLGLVGCASNDKDINHYIHNIPSPHSQNGSIPEGKVLPPDAAPEFYDGAVEYQAPPEVAANTGLLAVTAFCGNPIDKRDPQNLYAVMSVREQDGDLGEVTTGMAAAAVCLDGTINAADRPAL
ncbi:MAG TPA: hypothetical protein VLF62_03560 [Candidatus Saccharimonadales bacterium]|nr:hypothetical protein [Candidatus Saccharimonadales bacterium]